MGKEKAKRKDHNRGMPVNCFADAAAYTAALDRHMTARDARAQAAQLDRAELELKKLQRYADKDPAFAVRNAERIEQLSAMLTPPAADVQADGQGHSGPQMN